MSTSTPPSDRPRSCDRAGEEPQCSGSPRSGLLGFGLAALVAIVGVTTATLWGITGILDQSQRPAEFARADVPGGVSVVLTRVGPHVIYSEGVGRPTLSAGQVSVIGPAGAVVAVRPYTLDLRYDVPGHPGALGTAVAVFDADRTGSYLLGTGATGAPTGAQLAVGDDLAPSMVRAVVLPDVAGLLSVLAAVALAVRTWTQPNRRSHP